MEMEMKMKAIVITSGPEVVQLQDVADPTVGDNDVLIKIAAAALNRADLQQRNDLCPPPKGASPYPGLECSGTVIAVGSSVSRWKPGDQVCALLSGGGYAEKVAVPAGQVLPAPMGVSLRDAASFPEVACTVWSTVFMTSRLSAGESFLIHGGSSGIGTFAIQIAKHIGAKVFVTAGSEEHLAACKNLGADVGINYKTEDFALRVKEETGGKGVDVILDIIGAPYLQRNLDSLNMDGRLFIIGFQGGTITEVDLSCLLARRLTIQAAGLRNRSPENKAVIVEEVEKNVWPAIATGDVKPVVDKTFPLSDAVEAHKLMQSSHIDLMEDIYILQPEGYAIIGNDNQVCKLGKLLYCLKQSSRQQYKKCDPFMIEQGFLINTYDPYIYTRELDDGPLICLSLYVDMFIVVKSIEEIDKLLRALKCV